MTATLPASPATQDEVLTDEDAKALAWINEQARLFGKYGQLSIPAIMERLDKAEAEIERHRSSPSAEWREIEGPSDVHVEIRAVEIALAALPSPPITKIKGEG